MTVFALLSVALGASAFIIVMGVMDGYSVEFSRRSRDMLGDVVVNMPGYAIRMADLKTGRLAAQPGIEAAAANIREFGLLKIPKTKAVAGKRFAVEWCHLIGIDPETQLRVVRPKLEPELKSADFPSDGDEPGTWVVLGIDLMKSHNLTVGDEVWLVTSRQTGLDRVRKKRKLTVIGSLSFGLFEYDREVAYISRQLAAEVRGAPCDSATEIRVRLKEGVDLDEGVRQTRIAIGQTDQIRGHYLIQTFSETSNLFRA
ncbi:MAG: ABC transporter permease, partial [Candidatus Cloacimonetes bacterium]|nr:ABC transporter permease [Candidatus Cloacimonadota bacterium]